MTFSTQALVIEYLVSGGRDLPPAVHPVPREIDDRVAREKLRSLGVRPDELTEAQLAYAGGWEVGT